ncbi:putative RNA-binding protein with TRAM domain [Methanococcus voltae]|uniref:Deoxyribonuclease/rho motif-related TRAM n=1 Tax=Methanococcus voltae (strain ATCC BAA-1334 / A3) TaxID=456320 RepID=D7DQG2_METV3|nr:TRAM domain-containing protein [Methanococcus voltae]MBP2144319.1 putative RNA-binding protein with TRAM domain [Methanococcus voltae]MCS3901676.1 putative RNA-binding protein with TRAM domain [Methanococcus voltae]
MNSDNKIIPVKQGEQYNVTIEDMGKSGDGIARIDGFVIFVPEAQKGEEVAIKVTAIKEKFAFAEKI